MLTCNGNHIKHKNHMSKYMFMHRITYSVSHHGIIKSNIWQYNLMCYREEEKQFHHLQKYSFYHCNFRLPQQHVKTTQWQIITTLFRRLLFHTMWPVQCTFAHKKQFYGLAHTKVRCPLQVTRQWQGWNVLSFALRQHLIPEHKTASHRLKQDWGPLRNLAHN